MSIRLRAKYTLHSQTYLRCDVQLDKTNADLGDAPFYARCLIRGNEDVTLEVGTMVIFDTKSVADSGQLSRLPASGLYSLSSQVTGLRIQDGQLFHAFSPVTMTPITDRRQQPRQSNFFTVQLDPSLEGDFMVTDGSPEGLTLFGTRKHAFSGCSVGQELTVLLAYQGESIPIKARIRHLHYDLTDNKLMIGLATIGLKKRQTDIIQCLLDPDFIPDAEKQLNTQISADKISANH